MERKKKIHCVVECESILRLNLISDDNSFRAVPEAVLCIFNLCLLKTLSFYLS